MFQPLASFAKGVNKICKEITFEGIELACFAYYYSRFPPSTELGLELA